MEKRGVSLVICCACCEFPVCLDPSSPIRFPAYGLCAVPRLETVDKDEVMSLLLQSPCAL